MMIFGIGINEWILKIEYISHFRAHSGAEDNVISLKVMGSSNIIKKALPYPWHTVLNSVRRIYTKVRVNQKYTDVFLSSRAWDPFLTIGQQVAQGRWSFRVNVSFF